MLLDQAAVQWTPETNNEQIVGPYDGEPAQRCAFAPASGRNYAQTCSQTAHMKTSDFSQHNSSFFLVLRRSIESEDCIFTSRQIWPSTVPLPSHCQSHTSYHELRSVYIPTTLHLKLRPQRPRPFTDPEGSVLKSQSATTIARLTSARCRNSNGGVMRIRETPSVLGTNGAGVTRKPLVLAEDWEFGLRYTVIRGDCVTDVDRNLGGKMEDRNLGSRGWMKASGISEDNDGDDC